MAAEPRESMPAAMIVRGLIFMCVAVGIFGAIHYYIGLHFIDPWNISPTLKFCLWVMLWLALFSMPAGMILGRFVTWRISSWLRWFAYVWMGTFAVFLISSLTIDAISILTQVIGI